MQQQTPFHYRVRVVLPVPVPSLCRFRLFFLSACFFVLLPLFWSIMVDRRRRCNAYNL